jgi:hypothetical protein
MRPRAVRIFLRNPFCDRSLTSPRPAARGEGQGEGFLLTPTLSSTSVVEEREKSKVA